MQTKSLTLLQTRRFLPLFITQFFEAFNDNLFKNALAVMIAYTLVRNSQQAEMLVAIAGAVFILPFFLFSATAGQLADKYNKAILVRIIKVIEILAMCLGAIGFYAHNTTLLMTTLFILGTHSTFFGPIKYSILPDHLKTEELISGNALIQSSTFLSILFGTIIGSALINTHYGVSIVSTLGIICAFIGLTASFFIPDTKRANSDLNVSLNFFRETFRIISFSRENKHVFLAILGVSWFWLVGIVFVTLFPTFTKFTLKVDSQMVSIFLATFSIGIGLGSMLCEQIQRGIIDSRFVPLAILGMSIFTFDLYFHAAPDTSASLSTIGMFLSHWQGWHILLDLFFIAVCGGIFVVPLYTLVQHLSKETHRSRIIAANNIINAIFMVFAALMLAIFSFLSISVQSVFLIVAIVNLGAAIFICKLLPVELLKSILATILKLVYRVKVEGTENYLKANQQSLIIANHVSLLDGLLLTAFLPDRFIFAINTQFAAKWWLKPVLKLVDAFPLDPTNPLALKSLINEIQDHNKRCFIFPEGRLTVTGGIMKIYEGPGMIADKTNADIIPIRIDGAQYTPFSYLKNKVRTRWFPKITLRILPPRKFEVDKDIKGRLRRTVIGNKLYDLMTDLMFESSPYQSTLFQAIIDAKKIHGSKRIVLEDIQRKPMNYKQLIMRSFILGHYMNKQADKDENVIGILLPSAMATVISLLAVQIYGRTPSLLNFSTGIKNVCSACHTAKIKTIYTSHAFIDNAELQPMIEALEKQNVNIIYLETLKTKVTLIDKLRGYSQALFPTWRYRTANPKQHFDDAAVILFTSGSEGAPKGVVLSHKNILANCYQVTARVAFTPQDIVLNILPMFHAFGLTAATLLPIISGIKVFLYPSPLHYRIIPELAYDINTTIFFGTDTFLSAYGKSAHPYDFYNIRYIFAGAEKLKPQTMNLWSEKFGIRLFEGYGATEVAPVVSMNTVMHYKKGSVGRFLPSLDYRIEPVPGIEKGGRLFLSGPTVMIGYLFADNPGVIVPTKDGWYDTGDIVNVDEENYIEILGRAKRFAKIGGEMISLTAIEQAVADLYPDDLHAVVSVPDEKKGEVIILVTECQCAKREELLAHFKKHQLPEISLPKKILCIDKMFLLGAGKVDFMAATEYAIKH